ncbi:metaxin-1-like [Mytilus californianus]|uniref:metaxin-1-like n=1 Tax=Mytilus californianus TaxID=6549 RepID=UPI0022465345|nr:metaxin-1-like [Mytilus californianus]
MTDDVLNLEVWKGNWDLPSVDNECLAVWAYCKFSGLPTKVQKSHQTNVFQSSLAKHNLPVLQHGYATESQLGNILSYLKNQGLGVDKSFSNKELADISAFSALIEEKLLPAYLHHWWVDTDTYVEITRPFYAKASPFPLNYFVPGRIQRAAKQHIYAPRINDVINDEEVEMLVYKEAKECLNHLSYRLGENDFFFGDQPSSLDALVFGYVAPLLKAPLPNSQLANHVKGCPNLSGLCNRILNKYLPMSPEDLEEKRKRELEEREKKQVDSLEFPNKRRNMILAALFALSSMIGYAFISGLVGVVIVDEGDYDGFSGVFGDDEGGGDDD